MLTPIQVAERVKGMNYDSAVDFITNHGCTVNNIYFNGKNLIENVDKQFLDNRINVRVEGGLVMHARIG